MCSCSTIWWCCVGGRLLHQVLISHKKFSFHTFKEEQRLWEREKEGERRGFHKWQTDILECIRGKRDTHTQVCVFWEGNPLGITRLEPEVQWMNVVIFIPRGVSSQASSIKMRKIRRLWKAVRMVLRMWVLLVVMMNAFGLGLGLGVPPTSVPRLIFFSDHLPCLLNPVTQHRTQLPGPITGPTPHKRWRYLFHKTTGHPLHLQNRTNVVEIQGIKWNDYTVHR